MDMIPEVPQDGEKQSLNTEDEKRPVQMQRVYLKLSNGKTAVFSGPAVFSEAEVKLTNVQVVDLAFSKPFEVMMKVPKVEAPSATESKE